MRVTPLGLCLEVIVNEKPLNFKKTTSSVLSVLLLIYEDIGVDTVVAYHIKTTSVVLSVLLLIYG